MVPVSVIQCNAIRIPAKGSVLVPVPNPVTGSAANTYTSPDVLAFVQSLRT